MHHECRYGQPHLLQAALMMLQVRPGAAWLQNGSGELPLHTACQHGRIGLVAPLLAAAPAAATMHDARGWLPLHWAADKGHLGAVLQLLAAAPHTATAATRGAMPGVTPVQLAVNSGHPEVVAALLGACPTADAISALGAAGEAALPVLVNAIAAGPALTLRQWGLVPSPCPGLGRALPAALKHSHAQAAQVVSRLPEEDRQRLPAAALCLARLQRTLGLSLPKPAMERVLEACLG